MLDATALHDLRDAGRGIYKRTLKIGLDAIKLYLKWRVVYRGAVVLIQNEVKLLSSAFYHHRAQSFHVFHKMLSSKHDVRIYVIVD